MKALKGALLIVVFGWTAAHLLNRFREESADRAVALVVDWQEVRDASSRTGVADAELLSLLRRHHVTGLLVGASPLKEFLYPQTVFTNSKAAQLTLRQLEERGFRGIRMQQEAGTYRLVAPAKNWERIKDLEAGFDGNLLRVAQQAGLRLVLRVNNDPWLRPEKLFDSMNEMTRGNPPPAVLLNTDEVPGGPEALPQWVAWLDDHDTVQLLFEFRPPKSALRLAHKRPDNTRRAHTISPNELRDLKRHQQLARWRRAVEERSCRFLLLHVSPNDSLEGFVGTVDDTRQDLHERGWIMDWPKSRIAWTNPSFIERRLQPLIALALAILLPALALRLSLGKPPMKAYFQIAGISLAGACLIAVVAETPLTRVQIVPFRGIKAAFALGWLGSFLVLFPWRDIHTQLFKSVRRLDVLFGVLVLAVFGYMWIRTGNSGPGWKAGWEQTLRDGLESLLVARPRFKEFAIGYPLLFAGLYCKKWQPLWGRVLIGVGMIAPISMINTFCHLHSPLYLAFWRSFNGILIGTLIGWLLWQIIQKSRARLGT